jgi:hypothetical protein
MSDDGIRLYDPTAEPRKIVAQLAPRLTSLAGKRIGILDNTKANAGTLMLAVAEDPPGALRRRRGRQAREARGASAVCRGLAALSQCDLALVGSAD